MLKSLQFFIFLMLLFTTSQAQVTISGSAKSYAGKKIVIYTIADYISGLNNVVQTQNIDSQGNFKLQFDLSETRAINIAIPPFQGLMFVEPGKKYEIVFPGDQKKEAIRFDKSEVAIEFVNLPDYDLNLLIRQFNSDYFKFLNEHYYDFAVAEYRGSDVVKGKMASNNDGVDLYKKSTSDTTKVAAGVSNFGSVITNFYNDSQLKYGEHYKQLFFSDYVKYSLAEIELIAGRSKKSFYNEYFMSQPMLLQNPAYMKCFELFYSNYLGTRPKDVQAKITKAIGVERSGIQLISLLTGDSTALGSRVRTAAVIKGLKELYFDKRYSRSAISNCLKELSNEAEDIELRAIAKNSSTVLSLGKEGWNPDDFTLADENNDMWKWSENKGAYTYFIFFASWSASSVKEMMMLEKLHLQYNDYIRIVAINMDEDNELFQKYIIQHKTQKFEFLFGNGDALLRDKLTIKSIPSSLMVNPDGTAMFDYTRKPSEGVQADFEKIKKMVDSNPKQGLKTWRDKK